MHSSNRIVACFSAVLLAGLLCLPAGASQHGTLSPSVVLVLKLVSADRVQPITGIVVSDNGLVLVPADFVSEPAEIVVLDGGTDISTSGRPATVYAQAPDTGLAILSVEGLERPGIMLSETHNLYEDGLHLQAFPTARQIAEGAAPLQVPMQAGTTLPYVTGAILDSCGYLSGMALAISLQRPVPDTAPLIFDADVLRDAFDSLQVNVPGATCMVVPAEQEEVVADATGASAIQDETILVVDTAQDEPAAEESSLPVGELPEEQAPENTAGAKLEEPATVSPVPVADVIPWWLQLAGLLVLVVLARGVFVTFRKHASRSSRGTVQPASDEPDTVRLAGGRKGSAPVPRSGRDGADDLPDLDGLPEGCNGLVVLEGQLDPGHSSRYFRAVDTEQFDIVIGRGEADIRIEHAGISRSHARLVCRGGIMTLSDLDSANGIYINRVPCLPGEIMYVNAADEICLGDVCLSLNLIKREAEPS